MISHVGTHIDKEEKNRSDQSELGGSVILNHVLCIIKCQISNNDNENNDMWQEEVSRYNSGNRRSRSRSRTR